MNKVYTASLAGLLLASSALAFGDEGMHREMMRKMDTNNDGMISREEFNRAHERMWTEMKKNDKGMIDLKSAAASHEGMHHNKRSDEMVRLDCRMRKDD